MTVWSEGEMMLRILYSILLVSSSVFSTTTKELNNNATASPTPSSPESSSNFNSSERKGSRYESTDYWYRAGQSAVLKRINEKQIQSRAKNVIFFLGDGMSVATVTGARIYKGQSSGAKFGEEASLFFETYPYVGVSKTFCSDRQVADSSCSATAFFCGTKANFLTCGLKPSVKLNDCEGQMDPAQQAQSMIEWAQAAGKSTGVVTTSFITDATPSVAYAHIANRDWYTDAAIKSAGKDPTVCDDIAEQLILKKPGSKINVILGGGRRDFLPQEELDPETGEEGKRTDGKNLLRIWENRKRGKRAHYVWNKRAFMKVDPEKTDYLLGLFQYGPLDYVLDSQSDPSITEMTEKAIRILSKNPNGYFLMVEGGLIDKANHENQAQRAFAETLALDQAIMKATSMTNKKDTLIVVTADHAHGLLFSGRAIRGNPILGIGGTGADDLPYTTLMYATGPGFNKTLRNGRRYNLGNDNFFSKTYVYPSAVPRESADHGGDDVLIYSRGPFSHLLSGVMFQSDIPHIIGYAACIGPGRWYCDRPHD